MKITYYSKSNKCVHISVNKKTYQVYPGDTIELDNIYKNSIMQIYTIETDNIKLYKLFILFLKRLFLNIFNVFLLNVHSEWYQYSDPFILSVKYQSIDENVTLKYFPAEISERSFCIRKPQLSINDRIADSDVLFDINSLNISFFKFVFDLFSLWLYSSLTVALVFIMSGKFKVLFLVFVTVMCCTTIPTIFKVIRSYRLKKQLIEELRDRGTSLSPFSE